VNLTFNEQSFQPFAGSAVMLHQKFMIAAAALKYVNERYGFSHILFPSDLADHRVLVDKSFYEWIHEIPHQGQKNAILALVKRPFVSDFWKEQISELNAFYFENNTLGIEPAYCHGLATAYSAETVALSLHTHPFWEQDEIEIFKENENEGKPELVKSYNMCLASSFSEKLAAYFENIATVELIESPLAPNEKAHSFREDHGMDVLIAFAKKIKNSKFVVSIINSLPFNSQTTQFIRRVYPNGNVEIVLHWEDKGYGMVIQTTGRNLRETKAIAQCLRDEYDR
jgi:hypothetical protein